MTGVPVEIPQHIVDALYRAWDVDPKDAEMHVRTLWPLIETHVREQAAGEIEAIPSERVHFQAEAARIARGAARDGDTHG